ncbi:biopolymer transporter ExbD [bacterium]|nr:biopolymer transporter ExbD [bacterium]
MARPWYEQTLKTTRQRHARLLNLLDISPVVDILLILAVTLFVCSGLIYRPGVRLTLPTIHDPDAIRGDMTPLIISESGEIYLEGELTPTEPGDIANKLKAFIANDPEGTVLIQADKSTKHQTIIEILETLREAGVKNIAYAAKLSEPKK